MFRVVPIMWHAVRPSRVVDMPAVVNSFWMRKGFEGLTFFGQILTPTQAEADLFERSKEMKNHEMIHLRQAQSCGDSWWRFYLLYMVLAQGPACQSAAKAWRLPGESLRAGGLSPHERSYLSGQWQGH